MDNPYCSCRLTRCTLVQTLLLPNRARIAVGETVILLHPPLPLPGVSVGMERGCHQNDRTLADGGQALIKEAIFKTIVGILCIAAPVLTHPLS